MSRRSSAASVSFAAPNKASGNEIASDHSVSVKFRRLRGNGAVRTDNDPVDPLLRLVKLSFAMPFELRSTLVGEDRLVQLDLPAFEAPHDLFELGKGILETHNSDIGRSAGIDHFVTFYQKRKIPYCVPADNGSVKADAHYRTAKVAGRPR